MGLAPPELEGEEGAEEDRMQTKEEVNCVGTHKP